jgi:iron(II)-dependent oxidoreductase
VNYAAALAAPAPVGSYPNGASPYGALDMLGNAAEWTGTYVDWAEGYAVRGGSWYGYADELMTSGGLPYAADHWQDTIGLRLVAVLD